MSRLAGVVAFVFLGGCASLPLVGGGVDKQARREADEAAQLAESSCRAAKNATTARGVREQIKEFERFATAAEQKDPDAWKRDEPIAGRARAAIRSECPAEMQAALVAAEQRDAVEQQKLAEQTAAKKARLAELRAKLKGDRLRIFDKQGEPFKFDRPVESSGYWQYGVSISNGGEEVDCTVTYTFKGDKIARKEIARFCPSDPHPGLGP